jgi:hypothetical protein
MHYAQFFSMADYRGLPSASVVEVEVIGVNTATLDETIVRYSGPASFVCNVKSRELFTTPEAAAERLIERVEEYRVENSRGLDRLIEKIRSSHLQAPAVVG